MIRCKNIELKFNDTHIFKDFNIHIKKGENVCLAGKSGTGKSSLLKILQGYIIPDKGEVIINDVKLSKSTVREIRNQIIWIPQNVNLPVNNGVELLELMDVSEKKDKILSIMGNLGLSSEILKQSFHEISGGEKQRLLIATCLCVNKPIILLDEPTSALDNSSTEKLHQVIKSLTETTVLSTSHDKNWLDLVDRIIEL